MQTRMAWTAVMGLLLAGPASGQIKIAFIDPMSGPFANVGELGMAQFRAAVDEVNASGGVLGGQKLEVVPFDNKSSPQESLVVLQSVVDQGIRFITQGNGSNVAHALVDAVNKHNARDPGEAILYFNYAAVDPELTNAKCSFWHFRFDANTTQKMAAITDYLKTQPKVKKVYLIGQDYAHGHQVAKAAVEMLKEKRPDIQIVGNDLHPIGKVKDFSPYISKIKASGADTVITGNWGNDLSLLVKAAKDAGLTAKFYTYYGGGLGTPIAVGAAAAERMVQIAEWHMNVSPNKTEAYALAFKKKYNQDFYYLRINNEIAMWAKALDAAGSADPVKVARALEGMRFQADTGEIWMRKDDHQIIQPLFISVFTKVDGKAVKYEVEGTGFGFRTVATVPAKDTEVPTTCAMARP